ncbi:CidA/LrgA family protein [uncultured Treponema sp.]|uniref:CidA/LrgA family protein n=1 Tax=uncultured Treponema sp. TaxID=162155 RepID=UPI0025FCB439|nr:CidA/LrgA family protein [uncultured Treponema sp.]
MRLVKQFCILVITCFIGEILHAVIPLPVPASIYGLVLMFCALQFKIMPLSEVEQVSDSILSIMPLLFIPSTVGLILAWDILKVWWLQFLIIGILGTMVVFFVTGHVTQLVIRLLKKSKDKKNTD